MKNLVASKPKHTGQHRVPIFMILFACFTCLAINWYAVREMSRSIEAKVHEETNRELQQMSTLFADQISNSINSIDATLRMAGYLLSNGSTHLATLLDQKVISLEPLVLLTYVGKDGRVIETNMGPDPNQTDLSDSENVRVKTSGD